MRTLFVLAAIAAIAIPAHAADPCYTTSPALLTVPDTTGALGGDIYIDNDLCQFDCTFSIWIYQETNGIPGQQRQDEVRNDVANCDDGTTGDTAPS